ncbi:MAG: hypothetical protein ACREDI_08570 [Roseiarcus sp.]
MIRLANAFHLPLILLCASASAAQRLGSYPVDPAQVSVSRVSSGATPVADLRPKASATAFIHASPLGRWNCRGCAETRGA